MVYKLIDFLLRSLLAVLDKTGERWKTFTGLLLGAVLLVADHLVSGKYPVVAPYLQYAFNASVALFLAGIIHAGLRMDPNNPPLPGPTPPPQS